MYFVFIFNFQWDSLLKNWFSFVICTQFSFSISKKVILNIKNEYTFLPFSYSLKMNIVAFL